MKYSGILLIMGGTVLVQGGIPNDLPNNQKVLKAFSNLEYNKAWAMASKSSAPESKLVTALCCLYDQSHRNSARGLKILEELWKDSALDKKLKISVGLSYARAAQLMQLRKIEHAADGIDWKQIYHDLLLMRPTGIDSCRIFIYQIEEPLHKAMESSNRVELDKMAATISGFCDSYSGAEDGLAGIYTVLGRVYLRLGKYPQTVSSFESALKCGPLPARFRKEVICRIARISQQQLNDIVKARKYYELLVKDYPYSSEGIVAERYLKEIQQAVK